MSFIESKAIRTGLGWRRLLLAVLAPLLLLLAAELALRLAGFGYPVTWFVPKPGAPGWLVENPDFGRRFFPPGLLRVPPPTLITREKAPGTIRILVFGESAAMGDPKPAFGVARYLEVLLRERHPGAVFEVIPVAMTAISSHALLPMARECRALGADYWIVFAGNNELLGPFGAGSALGGGSAPWPVVRLALAAKATRLGQAIEQLAHSFRQPPVGASRWTGLRVLAGERVAGDSPQRTRVQTAFRHNLEDLVRAGQNSGARVLLSTVAVNLRDCAPFGAGHETAPDPAREREWKQRFERGREALAGGRVAEAVAVFREAATDSPRDAGVQFLLGESLLAQTNRDVAAASAAFVRARDLDTLPLRTDTALNEIIRAAAATLKAPLIDGAAALARESTNGIPGGDLFYEHVHLTPEGNYALARAFGESLEGVLPEAARRGARSEWASAVTCATRLALTPWGRGSAAELMLRRCLDAPFTNQLNHARHIDALAAEVSRQRRAQTPDSAKFIRGVYTNALAAAPSDHHLLRNYAEFLEGVGDFRGAAEQWQRVIDLLPHHPVAWLQCGSALRRTGKPDDAQPRIERAVALQPDWLEARLELAELLVARGRPKEAITACREALKLQPDHARAHLRLADALASDHQREAAVRSLEDAVRCDPRLWEARYLLGVEYAVQERIEDARGQFSEVVRLRPDHARGQFNLGIALARLKRWEEAGEHLAEAIRLEPANEAAKQALAQVIGIRQQLLQQRQNNPGEPALPAVPAPAGERKP